MIAFLDLETTGLDLQRSQIVEIAIVDETGRCLHSTRYDFYRNGLQTDIEIDAALAYNKLTREELCFYPKCSLEELYFIRNILKRADYVVAHNVAFDSAILKQTSIRFCGEDLFHDTNYKCSMLKLAKQAGIKSGRIKLPNLHLNPIAHSALSDVQNCRLLWLSLNTELQINDWNW